jgi:hypothetical protein
MDHAKHIIDGISLAAALATFVGWLPSIAAALSIVWTCLRIYETKTVQGWVKRRKNDR